MASIAETVAAQVERERVNLLDLTLRNPLLNYRLMRARGVEAAGDDVSPSDVFDALVERGVPVSFLPKPDDDGDAANPSAVSPRRRGAKKGAMALQTDETERSLAARLLKTHHTARTFMEEQGVNTLFIALGMVEWYESDASDMPRKAPVVLVPVTMGRSDVNAEFRIEYDGEEVGGNLSFIEKVRNDFAVHIPNLDEMAEGDEDEDGADDEPDIARYFQSVAAAVENIPRWRVDKDAVILGMFSFQKLLMYHDLDPDNWRSGANGGGGLADSRVVSSLYGGGGFDDPGPAVAEGERLDDHLHPQDLRHVVDADSSQASVIADVSGGRDLVVQGPPGTGKSQTIVNLIADAIGAGRKVLFVSEKMAALEVVKRRLDEIHLGDACLELHSRKTSKRAVLDEIRRVSGLGSPITDGIQENMEDLERTRDALNAYADAMNTEIGETGVTPHQALGWTALYDSEIQSAGGDIPAPKIAGVDEWSPPDFRRKRDVAENLRQRLAGVGVPSEHPFWGTRITAPLVPTRRRELEDAIRDANDGAKALAAASETLSQELRLWTAASPADADKMTAVAESVIPNADLARLDLTYPHWEERGGDIKALADAVVRFHSLRSEYDAVLTPAAWGLDANSLANIKLTLGYGVNNFLGLYGFRPADGVERARAIIGNLFRAQIPDDALRAAIAREEIAAKYGGALLSSAWDVDETELREMRRAVSNSVNSFWGKIGLRSKESAIRAAADGVSALASASETLTQALRLRTAVKPFDVDRMIAVAENVIPNVDLAPLNLRYPHWEERGGDIKTLADSVVRLQRLRSDYDAVLTPAAWGMDAGSLANVKLSLGYGINSFLGVFGFSPASGVESARAIIGNLFRSKIPDDALRAAIAREEIVAKYGGVLLSSAWDVDEVELREMRRAVSDSVNSLWGKIGLRSKGFKNARMRMANLWRTSLPDDENEWIAALDALIETRNLSAQMSAVGAAISEWTTALDAAIEASGLESRISDLKDVGEGAFGSAWMGDPRQWSAAAPLAMIFLGLIKKVHSGDAPSETLDSLRNLAETGEPAQIERAMEEARVALSDYRALVDNLHAELDMDVRAQFGTDDGIAALTFAEQSELLNEWTNRLQDFKNARLRMANLWRTALPDDNDVWIAALDALIEARTLLARMSPVGAAVGEWTAALDAAIEACGLESRISALQDAGEGAFGSAWTGDTRQWSAAAPLAVRFLDIIEKVHNGDVPSEILHCFQSLDETGDAARIERALADTRAALPEYRAGVANLHAALDLDIRARFGADGGIASLTFSEQSAMLGEWANRLPELDDLIGFNNGVAQARGEGLDALVEIAEKHGGAAAHLTKLLERARYESIIARAYAERPELGGFDFAIHSDAIRRFAERDRGSLADNRSRVASEHWQGLPDMLAAGEVAVLRREFEKRRRHMPIRRLMRLAGNAIQAVKPVFMMSPLSIANYVPPGSVGFDLVIFDEASQVKPVDALGALMRAKQIVIVGDTQQLPPTSFFDSMGDGDDDDEEEPVSSDIESVLGLCRMQGLPVETLRWHYRSRHESLIALSNQEFYDGELVVFASPDFDRDNTGLRFHHLPNAVYENGHNREEAKAVAQAVMEHARRSPKLTLGVAAFSIRQADAIRDELETLRRRDASQETFFAAHPNEPFFVKNLENVQGDERDVIYISVGYGRNRAGAVSMNFGPLNKEGGHRRLNVLITRSRLRCHVFANLKSQDIALNRTKARGVAVFKTFLEYAETGVMPADAPSESGRDFGSPFQKKLADEIRARLRSA